MDPRVKPEDEGGRKPEDEGGRKPEDDLFRNGVQVIF
jgi:hypothetical protein